MCEETLIKQCAPTLAGIKTGSLYICPCQDQASLTQDIADFNRTFLSRGLCLIPLRIKDGRALLYLFRPAELKQDLRDSLAMSILKHAGYPDGSLGTHIACLARRFRQETDFPHEVGLFLNYPPEDVKGFIDNHAANFKCSGMWKVYGDVEKAQHMFRTYKKCTETYCRLWKDGICMDHLAKPDKHVKQEDQRS